MAGDGCLIDGKQRQRLSELLAVGADHQRVVEAGLRARHIEREKGTFLWHIPFVGARGTARRELEGTGERGGNGCRLLGREEAHVIELDHRPDRPTAARVFDREAQRRNPVGEAAEIQIARHLAIIDAVERDPAHLRSAQPDNERVSGAGGESLDREAERGGIGGDVEQVVGPGGGARLQLQGGVAIGTDDGSPATPAMVAPAGDVVGVKTDSHHIDSRSAGILDCAVVDLKPVDLRVPEPGDHLIFRELQAGEARF